MPSFEVGHTAHALAKLDEDEKGIIPNDTLDGHQEMPVFTESGLYFLIRGKGARGIVLSEIKKPGTAEPSRSNTSRRENRRLTSASISATILL